MVVNLEKLFNVQEDPENPVYLSEKKGLLRFSFSQLVSVN
jgi:hypothetical protein